MNGLMVWGMHGIMNGWMDGWNWKIKYVERASQASGEQGY